MLFALSRLHTDNPVKVSPHLLVRYLAHCTHLSNTQTFGILNAIQPTATMPAQHSVRALAAWADFWGRTREHTRNLDWFEAMAPLLDNAMKVYFEECAAGSCITPAAFWQSWRNALSLFAPDEDWARIFATDDPVANAPMVIKAVARQCTVGEIMFAREIHKVDMIRFSDKLMRA